MRSSPPPAAPPSAFARLGGEAGVRHIIGQLVARMADDAMIGFFFAAVPLGRLAEREYEHAAVFLGADLPYRGRPLEVAHRRLTIRGGQFERRLAILAAVLDECQVPGDVRAAWLGHQRAQRERVVGPAAAG